MKSFFIQPISQLEAMRRVRKKMPPVGSTFRVFKGKGSYDRKKEKQRKDF